MPRKKSTIEIDTEKYYTVKQVAELEEVNVMSVYTWCQRSLIECTQLANGRWIIPKSYKRPEIPDWHRDNPNKRK